MGAKRGIAAGEGKFTVSDASITVDANVLRSTADAIHAHMEHALGIAKGYLDNQENVMNPATWSGAGVVASHMTATEVTGDLNKVLMGERAWPRASSRPRL